METVTQIIDVASMIFLIAFGAIFFHLNIYQRACRLLDYMVAYVDENNTIIGFKQTYMLGFWGYGFWFRNLNELQESYSKYRPIVNQIKLIRGYRQLYIKYAPIIVLGIGIIIYLRQNM